MRKLQKLKKLNPKELTVRTVIQSSSTTSTYLIQIRCTIVHQQPQLTTPKYDVLSLLSFYYIYAKQSKISKTKRLLKFFLTTLNVFKKSLKSKLKGDLLLTNNTVKLVPSNPNYLHCIVKAKTGLRLIIEFLLGVRCYQLFCYHLCCCHLWTGQSKILIILLQC